MISALIILFVIFISAITIYFFLIVFKRGELFDITSTRLRKESKLNKYLDEMKSNLEYIESLPSEWHYIKTIDNITLAGRLFKYPKSKKIVILFHGYRSIAENDFSFYFKWYFENGYTILLVDQRAHGKSQGDYITFGIKERYDCLKWCEYVNSTFEYVDEIILGGMSMGATTVLLASELELPSKVKCIIADCGFTAPKDIIMKVATSKYGIDASIILPLINIMCQIKAGFNIYECNVKDAMERTKIPILFIHGLSDDFVPCRMTRENYEVCRSKKDLLLVECVNHGFSCVQHKDKVYRKIDDFLKSLS